MIIIFAKPKSDGEHALGGQGIFVVVVAASY
jgi:hypothetical protein